MHYAPVPPHLLVRLSMWSEQYFILYTTLAEAVAGLVFHVSGTSLVPSPCAPPGEKRSGEQSQISYSPKVVRTNEIARSVIIT